MLSGEISSLNCVYANLISLHWAETKLLRNAKAHFLRQKEKKKHGGTWTAKEEVERKNTAHEWNEKWHWIGSDVCAQWVEWLAASIYDWQISTKCCKCRRDKWNKRWNRLILSNCLWVSEWVSSNDWFPPRIRLMKPSNFALFEQMRLCDAILKFNCERQTTLHYSSLYHRILAREFRIERKKNRNKINLNDFKGISSRCTKSNPEITNSGQSIAQMSFPWSTSVPYSAVRSISDWHGRHSQMVPTIDEGHERWHIIWVEPGSHSFIVNARDVLVRMCVRLRTCLAVDCVPVAHTHTHISLWI